MQEVYKNLTQQHQRQDSTSDQLWDIYALANKAGCYDAADLIMNILLGTSKEKIDNLRRKR